MGKSSCGSGYAGTVPMLALLELSVNSCLSDESFAVWKQGITRVVEQFIGSIISYLLSFIGVVGEPPLLINNGQYRVDNAYVSI